LVQGQFSLEIELYDRGKERGKGASEGGTFPHRDSRSSARNEATIRKKSSRRKGKTKAVEENSKALGEWFREGFGGVGATGNITIR